MKKILFSLLFTGFLFCAKAQTTYYWVGGTATASAFTLNSNWSTVLGSVAGPLRTGAALNTDILVFDGSDYGGGVTTGTATANLTSTACGQLKLQNGARVNIQRATTTTGTLTIAGGTGDDFLIGNTDSLTISSIDPAASAIISISAANTGSISGKLNLANGGARLYCLTTNGVQIESGGICYTSTSLAGAYPFGGSVANSVERAFVFKAGAMAVYRGGTSLVGNSATYNPLLFQTGSTLVFEAANVGNMFVNRSYANVTVRPSPAAPATPVTVNVDAFFYKIDTLRIDPLATFNLRASGTAPVWGDIINNGTFATAAPISTSNLIMTGTVPQSIKGTGTFGPVGGLCVATGASVTLEHSLQLNGSSTSSVTGQLNLQNNTLSGTSDFQFRAATNTAFTGNTIVGDYTITAVTPTSAMALGLLVTGPGIQPDTYITATNSGTGVITLSKPATAAGTTASFTSTGNPAVCELANAGGVDGAITTTGTRGFGTTTSYIFNTATVTPLSDISNPDASSACRNLTLNAAVSTNRPISVSGVLTLNTGKFTISPTDVVRILSTGSIGGTINSTNYIATATSGSNLGLLRIDTFSTPKVFPIGTPNYYMPVTVSPLTESTFSTGVFEGITEEGTPNGTPFSAAKKAGVVDAVWSINRNSTNTDMATVNVSWPSILEGSAFATYPDANVGIAHHNGAAWSVTGGTGDNTANNASNSFSSFSPFGVGKVGNILPVQLLNFVAVNEPRQVLVRWTVEQETANTIYTIERSANGRDFQHIGTLTGTNSRSYGFTDTDPLNGSSYYRLKTLTANGPALYSGIQYINRGAATIMVSPNPVQQHSLQLQVNKTLAGKMPVQLYNAAGQLVFSTIINYPAGYSVQKITLPAGIVKGLYRLKVGEDGQGVVVD